MNYNQFLKTLQSGVGVRPAGIKRFNYYVADLNGRRVATKSKTVAARWIYQNGSAEVVNNV